MMKRLSILIAIVLLIGALCACTGNGNAPPKGVIHRESVDCYIFMLPAGKSVQSYFQLEGPVNGVHGTDPYGNSLGLAEYRAESRGGYVAYKGSLVAYVPAGGSENDASSLCGSLLWDTGNYMTFAEACKYLPWLTE